MQSVKKLKICHFFKITDKTSRKLSANTKVARLGNSSPKYTIQNNKNSGLHELQSFKFRMEFSVTESS